MLARFAWTPMAVSGKLLAVEVAVAELASVPDGRRSSAVAAEAPFERRWAIG